MTEPMTDPIMVPMTNQNWDVSSVSRFCNVFFVRFTIGMFFLQLCTISVPLCHLTHGFGMQSGVILGFAPQNIYVIITIIIIITIVTIIIMIKTSRLRLVDCPTQLTLIFIFWYLYLSVGVS